MATTKTLLLTATLFLSSCLSATAATFKISPNRGTFNQNCTSRVDVVLDTENKITNAADIIIEYDPSKIEIIDADPSTTGIQVITGNVFTNYFGNIVDTNLGIIRLTGASFVGSFGSRGTFATIEFKPKYNNGTATFNIRFTGADQYNTLDSNIADINTSNDLLSSVDNGFFAFSSGSCIKDTTPPIINFIAPINHQQNVPSTANLLLDISDTGSGVDINSVELIINGQTYRPNNSQVTTNGNSSLYHFLLKPIDLLFTNQANSFLVKASDLAGNFKTQSINFNVPSEPPLACLPIIATPTPGSITPTPIPDAPSPTPTQTSVDSDSPIIDFVFPKSKQLTDITPVFQINFKDQGSGIDKNSINIKLNEQTFSSDSPNIVVSGNPSNTNLKMTLSEALVPNVDYKLTATVSDMSSNSVSQTIVFRTKNSIFNQIARIFSVSSNKKQSLSLWPFIFCLLVPFLIYFLYKKLHATKVLSGQPYGLVFNSDTYEPISNARVVVVDELGKNITTAQTNIFGIFALSLQSGKYRFIITAPEHSFPGTKLRHPLDFPLPYQGQTIEIRQPEIPYVEIPLDPSVAPKPNTNYGTVTNRLGQPLENICVELWQTKTNQPISIRYTNKVGQYRFQTPNGKYELKVHDKTFLNIDTRHLVDGFTTVSQDIQLDL